MNRRGFLGLLAAVPVVGVTALSAKPAEPRYRIRSGTKYVDPPLITAIEKFPRGAFWIDRNGLRVKAK